LRSKPRALHNIALFSKAFSLQIWAYCFMDNHVHLLVVPEKEDSLARSFGLTNQVYTQYLNRKLKQSDRTWQNRFVSFRAWLNMMIIWG